MSLKLTATCDNIICIVPNVAPDEKVIEGIIVPAAAQKALERKNPYRQYEVHSVGPACKTIKAGDTILVNGACHWEFPVGDFSIVWLTEQQCVGSVQQQVVS